MMGTMRERQCLLLLGVCLVMTTLTASASTAADKRSLFSGSLDVTETYDDNILKYSSADLDLLASNTKPAKFAIRQPDDFRTSLDLNVDLSPVLFENSPTRLRLRYEADLFAKNSVENYQAPGVSLRQNISPENYVQVGARYIPHFYLRNLFFADSTIERYEYVKAIFSRQSYSFQVGRSFSRHSSASLEYQYDKTDYNSEFDERDNRANSFSSELNLGSAAKGRVRVAYTHKVVKADGADMGPAKEDISNRSDRVTLGFEFPLWSKGRQRLSLAPSFVYENQQYTTPRTSDPYHYGRKDNFYRVSSALSYRWTRQLEQFLRYSYDRSTTNRTQTLDVGQYTENRLSLGFTVSF